MTRALVEEATSLLIELKADSAPVRSPFLAKNTTLRTAATIFSGSLTAESSLRARSLSPRSEAIAALAICVQS